MPSVLNKSYLDHPKLKGSLEKVIHFFVIFMHNFKIILTFKNKLIQIN